MSAGKIVQQRLHINAWKFARPHDLGMIDVGQVIDTFRVVVVLRRVAHDHQMLAGRGFELRFCFRSGSTPRPRDRRNRTGMTNLLSDESRNSSDHEQNHDARERYAYGSPAMLPASKITNRLH